MTDSLASTDPDLREVDIIMVNSSAGKDSQTMLRLIAGRAEAAGVLDRVLVVHFALGRVEWPATAELARAQADHYGVRYLERTPPKDLPALIEKRGMWPSSDARYCTSTLKRDVGYTVMTKLVREVETARGGTLAAPVRILNCMGLRAEESPARAKLVALRRDNRGTNGRRVVDTWLPILHWTKAEVWADIRASGVPYHPAYDLGSTRLSCCLCVLGSRADLLIGARARPDLAAEYVALEARMGHRFKQDLSIADIAAEAAALGPLHLPMMCGARA